MPRLAYFLLLTVTALPLTAAAQNSVPPALIASTAPMMCKTWRCWPGSNLSNVSATQLRVNMGAGSHTDKPLDGHTCTCEVPAPFPSAEEIGAAVAAQVKTAIKEAMTESVDAAIKKLATDREAVVCKELAKVQEKTDQQIALLIQLLGQTQAPLKAATGASTGPTPGPKHPTPGPSRP